MLVLVSLGVQQPLATYVQLLLIIGQFLTLYLSKYLSSP